MADKVLRKELKELAREVAPDLPWKNLSSGVQFKNARYIVRLICGGQYGMKSDAYVWVYAKLREEKYNVYCSAEMKKSVGLTSVHNLPEIPESIRRVPREIVSFYLKEVLNKVGELK